MVASARTFADSIRALSIPHINPPADCTTTAATSPKYDFHERAQLKGRTCLENVTLEQADETIS